MAWHAVDSTRNVAFPGFFETEAAEYSANTAQLFAELAHPTATKRGAAELFGGLSWVHVGTGGFTESAGAAALAASRENANVGYPTLGIRAATSPQRVDGGVTITPHGSLAWQYAFGDLAPAQNFAFASNGIAFGIFPVCRSCRTAR